MKFNIMEHNCLLARGQFAQANGWEIRREFCIDVLAKNKVRGYGNYDRLLIDHPDFFKLGRYPVAIVSHNYNGSAPGSAGHLRESVATTFAGRLVLHVPPAGKDASWYYPGITLPMCLTRPDMKEIVWPTEQQMAKTSAEFAKAVEQVERLPVTATRYAEAVEQVKLMRARAAILTK
jgi:hypothetical protein